MLKLDSYEGFQLMATENLSSPAGTIIILSSQQNSTNSYLITKVQYLIWLISGMSDVSNSCSLKMANASLINYKHQFDTPQLDETSSFALTYCLVTRTGGGPPASQCTNGEMEHSVCCTIYPPVTWFAFPFMQLQDHSVYNVYIHSILSTASSEHSHPHTLTIPSSCSLFCYRSLWCFFVQPQNTVFPWPNQVVTQVWLCNDYYKSCHVHMQMLLFYFSVHFLFWRSCSETVASQATRDLLISYSNTTNKVANTLKLFSF